MSEIKVVDQQGEEVVQETQQEIKGPEVEIYPHELMLVEQVAKLFDLAPSEITGYKNKLETLIEYAKYKTDDHSADGIKWALRQAGMRLGTPPLGEKPINYLHVYAKLYVQGKHIEEQKAKFLRGETDE